MENKKGEMTIGVLVAIILGLIVLVVIALGFSMGWSELWQRIGLFGGGSTLSSVGQACQIACTTSDATTWCNRGYDVKEVSPTNLATLDTKFPAGATRKFKLPTDLTKKGTVEGITCKDLTDAGLISLGDQCKSVPSCQKSCKGTPADCATKTSENDCTAVSGCSWA